jgi:hypothetical protein
VLRSRIRKGCSMNRLPCMGHFGIAYFSRPCWRVRPSPPRRTWAVRRAIETKLKGTSCRWMNARSHSYTGLRERQRARVTRYPLNRYRSNNLGLSADIACASLRGSCLLIQYGSPKLGISCRRAYPQVKCEEHKQYGKLHSLEGPVWI